jgi:hypothetical protein
MENHKGKSHPVGNYVYELCTRLSYIYRGRKEGKTIEDYSREW